MNNALITAEVKVLTPKLILELLENGYTRVQDKNTYENDTVSAYLCEHFPNIFNESNINGQITAMFSRPPLKGRRTKKHPMRKNELVFSWGVSNALPTLEEVVIPDVEEVEQVDELPTYVVESPETTPQEVEDTWATVSNGGGEIPVEYKAFDVVDSGSIENITEEKAPWEL